MFSSFSISQLLGNLSWGKFDLRPTPTEKRKQLLTRPGLVDLMMKRESSTTLRDFYYECAAAKAAHLYLDLNAWFLDLQDAGMPPRDSEAWRLVSFPTEEAWAAKETAREEKHAKERNELLVECLLRASDFARLKRDRMVRYLERQPDPFLWRNITALVDKKTLDYVEQEVRYIREFEEDCAEGYRRQGV